MLLILLFFIIGILGGRLLRNKQKITRIASLFSFGSVLILLVLLGYQAGSNPNVVNHFDRIGLHGIIISLCATFGSLIFIWVFAKQFLSQKSR